MKKGNQTDINPFPYSDSNKRYYTYEYYLRKTFGGKCAKIPLDAGFTCPNIDGKCGVGGCIYCSGRGSGDFAEPCFIPIKEQYEITKKKLSSKWPTERCIPYFQAHTNTYAPADKLRRMFESAIEFENAVGLNIATRADCLEDDVIKLLSELAEKTVLTVELGLQSSNDETARLINRGHSFVDFIKGYNALRKASRKINICVHIIFGLPGENEKDMLKTVRDVADLHPDQVKIHLLHVLKNTKLCEMYEAGNYIPMEQQVYVKTVIRALELLPQNIVVARITGDGMEEMLVAPQWSRRKIAVINDIDKLMFEENTWQGKKYFERY